MITLEEIDTLILEDIENPNHPSEFIVQERYSVLILRLPEVLSEGVDIASLPFVISNGSVCLYNRNTASLDYMGKLEELVRFLDVRIDRLIKDVQVYHYDIEMLEESLYEENISETFMQEWLRYKKDVSLIHRVMFHTTLAFELFVNHYKKNEEFDLLAFADILEHMGRIRDLSKAAMEKLDNLYDFYRAKVDERMNKNMYYLTIISGIFLPLTLITGFFGMNTGGLPYTTDPNGTLKVVVISLFLEALMIIPFFMMNSQKMKRFKRRH